MSSDGAHQFVLVLVAPDHLEDRREPPDTQGAVQVLPASAVVGVLSVAAVGASHDYSVVEQGRTDGVGVDVVPVGDAGKGLSAAVEVDGVANLVVGQAASSAGDRLTVEVGSDGGPVDAGSGGEFVDAGAGSVGVGERRDGGRRQRFQLGDQP
jgi:hypothetical protein